MGGDDRVFMGTAGIEDSVRQVGKLERLVGRRVVRTLGVFLDLLVDS